jgi:hypothetical protein
MMFAEFYHLRAREDGTTYYVGGVGDRSVIILDGRMSMYNMHFISLQECRKRGYDGYRIARGRLDNPFYMTAAVMPAHSPVTCANPVTT